MVELRLERDQHQPEKTAQSVENLGSNSIHDNTITSSSAEEFLGRNNMDHDMKMVGIYDEAKDPSVMATTLEDILQAFCKTKLWSDSSSSRCGVKIVDTVIFNDGSAKWFYTAKTGNVSKKRDENVSLTRVYSRFCKVALGNRDNVLQSVCTLHTLDGKTVVLDKQSFDEVVLNSPDDRTLSGVSAIQLYVKPKGGGGVYRNEYTRPKAAALAPVTKTYRVMENGTVVRSVNKAMNEELDAITRKVVSFLETTGTVVASSSLRQNAGEKIQKIVVDYILDHHDRFWLQGFNDVRLVENVGFVPKGKHMSSSKAAAAAAAAAATGDGQISKSASMPELTTNGKGHSQEEKIGVHQIHEKEGERNASGCWGDFCHVAKDQESWSMAAPGVDTAVEAIRNLSSRDLSLTRFQKVAEQVAEQDGDNRGGDGPSSNFKKLGNRVAYKTIVLARAQAKFISSEVSSATRKASAGEGLEGNPSAVAFLRDWQSVDAKLDREFSKKHAKQHGRRVPCCAACASAYAQIEEIRRAGFGVVALGPRPMSEQQARRNTTSRQGSRQRSRSRQGSRQRSRGGDGRSPSRRSRSGLGISEDPIEAALMQADDRMRNLTMEDEDRPLTSTRPLTRQSTGRPGTTTSTNGRRTTTRERLGLGLDGIEPGDTPRSIASTSSTARSLGDETEDNSMAVLTTTVTNDGNRIGNTRDSALSLLDEGATIPEGGFLEDIDTPARAGRKKKRKKRSKGRSSSKGKGGSATTTTRSSELPSDLLQVPGAGVPMLPPAAGSTKNTKKPGNSKRASGENAILLHEQTMKMSQEERDFLARRKNGAASGSVTGAFATDESSLSAEMLRKAREPLPAIARDGGALLGGSGVGKAGEAIAVQTSLHAEITKLRSQVTALATSKENLQRQYAASLSSNKAKNKRISELEIKVEELAERSRHANLDAQARYDMADLEKKLKLTKAQLHAEMKNSEQFVARAKELEIKMSNAKQEWVRTMKEKDETQKKELLALQEQLNSEFSSQIKSMNANESEGGARARALMKSVNDLQEQLAHQQQRWSKRLEEKETSWRLESLKQEEAHQKQLQETDSVISTLQDKAAEAQSKAMEAVKDVEISRRREEELGKRIKLLSEEREQLQKEMSLLQQSLASAASMDDGSNAADIQLHALKAKLEAKERHFTNEMDFVKGQLDSERKLRQELEAAAADNAEAFVKERNLLRRQIGEAEAKRRHEAKQMEERFRAELAGPRAEVMRLEDKIQQLQSSMTDMIKDLKLARQQHQSAKQEASVLKGELTSVQEQLEASKMQYGEMEELSAKARKAQREESQARASIEAKLRTFQHESQFLKSQLESEMAHKVELEKAMAAAKARFVESEAESTRLAKEMEASKLKHQAQVFEMEAQLNDITISLEGDVSSLQSQLKEALQTGAKAKDQLKVDQASLEAVRKSAKRLEGELESTKEQLRREREAAIDAADRHKRAVHAMEKAVDELSEARKKEREEFQRQLQSNMDKVTQGQRAMIDQRVELDGTLQQQQRQVAVARIFGVMECALTRQKAKRLAQWRDRHKSEFARDLLQKSLTSELQSARAAAKEELHRTVTGLREAHGKELEAKLGALNDKMLTRLDEVSLMSAEDKATTVMQLEEKTLEIVGALKSKMEQLQSDLEAEAEKSSHLEDEVRGVREANDIAIKAARAARDAAVKHERELGKKRMKEEAEAFEGRLEKQREEMEAEFKLRTEKLEKNVREQIGEAIAEARASWDKEKEEALEHERGLAEERVESAIAKGAAAVEEEIQRQKEMQEKLLGELEERLRKEHELAVANIIAKKMAEVERMQKEKAIELAKASAAAEDARKTAIHEMRQSLLQQKDEELSKVAEDHAAKLDALRNKANEIKANALKYQTAKWQTTLKECMAEASRDKEMLKAHLTKSKDDALQALAQKAANDLEVALKRAHDETTKKIAALEEQHAKAIEETKKEGAAEKAAALDGATERLRSRAMEEKKKMQEEFQEEMKEVVAKIRKDHELALNRTVGENLKHTESLTARLVAEREAALQTAASESKRMVERLKSEAAHEALQKLKGQQELHAAALKELRADLEEKSQKSLDLLKETAIEEQTRAVEAIRNESQKLIEEAEAQTERAEQKRRDAARELERVTDMLEDAEDNAYDMQTKLKRVRRTAMLQNLFLVQSQLRAFSKSKAMLAHADDRWEEELDRAEEAHNEHRTELQNRIKDLEKVLKKHESTHAKMHDTLVNHKRALLLEHKAQSTVLQADLAKILEQKAEVESEHRQVMKGLSQLEGSVKEVERQMRELGKVSAIRDGRVDVAHAKKKRRLDQEFEALLAKAADKKDHLQRVEGRLQELEDAHRDKEDEMKELERELVELLVDQQKKLLAVLKQASEKDKVVVN